MAASAFPAARRTEPVTRRRATSSLWWRRREVTGAQSRRPPSALQSCSPASWTCGWPHRRARVPAVPSVSVVVPARDAGAWLPACRAALGAQEVEHELVLVDDGSREPLAGARVRLSPARGAAAARNAGVAAASGEVVAFTDADCAPAPGWLTAALAALDAGADVVQGPVVPPPGAHVGPFDRTLRVTAPSPLFETANLVVRRAWLERAGGFAAPVAAG
ncbi:MAG: glycosyltransferase, partial [Solirubrobacterales bacterium]|nr:glycosyltransferase [Solirubrobacterales bacterium]